MKRNQSLAKAFAVLLTLALLLPCIGIGAQAAAPAKYTIGNPYATVNWDTWKQYKAQLHCQSNASDGEVPLNEVVEEHYKAGYDILAITDHMTPGVPWNQVPRTVPLARLVKYSRTKMLPVTPLTDQRRQEIIKGVGRGGRGMMEVTQGVELNGAVISNNHIQGFFCDYGQGLTGVDRDYETPIREVHKRGGLTFINHAGDTAKPYESDNPATFYNDPFWIDKYARLFYDYSSCVGIGINSANDDHTKYDRYLYDNLLQKLIPYGITPWAFTFSDEHSPGQFDRAFTMHLMPEKTVPALRKSMENGTFFGVSRYARLEKNDDWVGEGAVPAVSRIKVDQAAGTIKITGSNYDSITWISNGKKIATGATLKLSSYDAKVGCYVRAYLLGPGGILYTQPFTVLRAGQTLEKQEIKKVFDYSNVLRFFSDALTFISPKYTPLWFIWHMIAHFDPYIDAPWLTNLFVK